MSKAHSKTILIVDDTLAIRKMLKEFFELQGCYTRAAENAEKALEILQKKSFDLILVNYEMPDMMGNELIRLIKERYPHLKVWGMSSLDKRESFYQAGADFFIEKPFTLSKLKALLKTI